MMECFSPLLDGSRKLYQKFQNKENRKKRIKRSTKGFSLHSRR